MSVKSAQGLCEFQPFRKEAYLCKKQNNNSEMDIERIKEIWEDLRYVTLFPRRYETRQGLDGDYWREVMHRMGNTKKKVDCCPWHWYVIEYNDGHKETTRLRVLKGGFFSGMSPALYRGAIIPKMVCVGTYDHIKSIRLAF